MAKKGTAVQLHTMAHLYMGAPTSYSILQVFGEEAQEKVQKGKQEQKEKIILCTLYTAVNVLNSITKLNTVWKLLCNLPVYRAKLKLPWMAPCQAAKHSLVKEVFVKAEIYSQSMLTQMSNTLCLKLKLASALHFPNLGLAALFIKLPDTSEWERDFLFSCFVL